ncbi:AlpA family phage regulatory protein [Pseudomonas sp. Z3-6]|uniref:helix-turn-helix transcriptional regulator n=1 Tax=Pseudomonas sp. Z3-6 TaxID=2817411 RepID=UPI003DA987F8
MSRLDRFLREKDVIAATSLSHSTIWRGIKEGRFPRAVLISPGRVGWRESSIVAWQKIQVGGMPLITPKRIFATNCNRRC